MKPSVNLMENEWRKKKSANEQQVHKLNNRVITQHIDKVGVRRLEIFELDANVIKVDISLVPR